MKIFFYIHTLKPGGAEKQCSMIAAALKKRYGFESVVILNWGDDAKPEFIKYLEDADVELIALPENPIARIVKLYSVFRANKGAILFNYLTYCDFVGGLIARLAGLKRVVGGIETDRMFGAKFVAERIAHKFLSPVTICNSYKAYEFFTGRGFNKSKMVVMPSAIEMTEDQLAGRDHNSKSLRVICIGRFVAAKDYLTWIDVIAKVIVSGRSVDAVIVGYGELEGMIRSHIAETGMDKVVKIMPGESADVRALLYSSDIYLSTSIREGTSNTILEAMEAALPIVATDVGDNSRMVEDGNSGFICKPRDTVALSEALIKLLDDGALRVAFGIRAREVLKEKYSVEKITSDYHSLIKELE